MRTDRASAAQGFAQIMQAFESPVEDSVASKLQDSQRDKRSETDEDHKLSAESDDDSQVDSDDQSVDESTTKGQQSTTTPGADTTQAGQEVEQSHIDVQEPTNPTHPQSSSDTQGTQANDASMRSLENQSQHAKLSIKSTGDAQLQASLGNITDRAVQTRLSENTQANPSRSTAQIQRSQAQSSNTESALSGTTEPIKNDGHVQLHVLVNDADQAEPNQSDQSQASRFNLRQVASQAADISTIDEADTIGHSSRSATSSKANLAAMAAGAANIASTATAQSAHHVQAQPPSAAQPVQAISGAGAGNVGTNLSESNTGSLVEKLKAPEQTDQTKQAAFLTQVQRGMASLLRSGKGEMTLKLTPGHLGEIKIRLKSDGNRLGVRFETSSKEANELLSSGLKELTSAMKAKGLHLDQIQMEHRPAPGSGEPSTSDANARSGFNDSGANPDHSNHTPNEHRRNRSHSNESDLWADEEQEHPQAKPLWTELGLDAIA